VAPIHPALWASGGLEVLNRKLHSAAASFIAPESIAWILNNHRSYQLPFPLDAIDFASSACSIGDLIESEC
jgi:hypothetical protein